MSQPPVDAKVSIGHVHLKVADLERSLRFYCGVLGFELTQRYGPPRGGGRRTVRPTGAGAGRARVSSPRRGGNKPVVGEKWYDNIRNA